MPFFQLTHQDKETRARAGVIHTDHGDIATPAFMPVGTQASVKTLDQTDLNNISAQVILGNTYHLHLRPGEDLIAGVGGLHKFMNWNRPILTDSGGFQVFSLGLQKNKKTINQKNDNTKPLPNPLPCGGEGNEPSPSQWRGQGEDSRQARLVSIDEDGVTFRSHLDGSTHRFTPESATEIQHKLGADIIMAFDECTPDDAPVDYIKEAMRRTHRWAERCLWEHRRFTNTPRAPLFRGESPVPPKKEGGEVLAYRQFLFGIIQGSNNKALREESARFISSLDFDGIAIGGESIGYNMKATAEILDWVYPLIPENKPHYAMGIGLSPADLLVAVEHGVDMFDCVAPTRLARHGMLFSRDLTSILSSAKERQSQSFPLLQGEGRGVRSWRCNITNSQFAKDTRPIDENCDCSTCQNYSRLYLHHLFAADEMTGMRLASIHNLRFMIKLMEETRQAILEDKFSELKKKWI